MASALVIIVMAILIVCVAGHVSVGLGVAFRTDLVHGHSYIATKCPKGYRAVNPGWCKLVPTKRKVGALGFGPRQLHCTAEHFSTGERVDVL